MLDRSAFAFTQYDLAASVVPAEQKLSVTGTITLRNQSRVSQRYAALQISSSLNWGEISIGARPANYLEQGYTSDIDHTGELAEAIVTLPTPLAPGATVQLAVRYSGTIAFSSGRLDRVGAPADVQHSQDWDAIASAYSGVRGAGNVVWYPVAMEAASLSEDTDLADVLAEWTEREQEARFDLKLCHTQPIGEPQVAVAGGTPVPGSSSVASSGPIATACTEFRWVPLGFSAPGFAIAPFHSLAAAPQFTLFYLPNFEAPARRYGELAAQIMPLVHEWFGAARQPAALVQLPEHAWAPYEGGTTLFTPLPAIFDENETYSAELALAHQLTHAAIFSPRPWINEGVAHFAQALEREHQAGRAAALEFMARRLPALAEAEKLELDRQAKAPGGRSTSLIGASNDVYYRAKAMYCWWMLRDIVGDVVLQRALGRYRAADDRDSGYMQRLLEQEFHQPLDWFFNAWVYRDNGLPDLSISSVAPRQTLDGGYLVAITVENSGGAEAEAPILMRSAQSETRARLRVAAHSRATLRLQIGQYPTEVEVNDGSVPENNFQNNNFKVPPKAAT